MPRSQNRNIKKKIEFSCNIPDFPEQIKKMTRGPVNYVKEPEETAYSKYNFVKCHNTAMEKCLTDLPTLSSDDICSNHIDVSSSSSLSWEEDFEAEATQQVKSEFERMDRVLRGFEPIPNHYNHDEYVQWMTTFPNMSINADQHKKQKDHSVICENADFNLKNNNVKKVIIEEVCEQVHNRLYTRDQCELRQHREILHKSHKKSDNKTSTPIESFLRISPIPLLEVRNSIKFERRQKSSRSIIDLTAVPSKLPNGDSPEYSSLPYLPTSLKMEPCVSAKNLIKRSQNPKNFAQITNHLHSTPRSNYFHLPPINLYTNHYRSISATPRQQSIGLSALSVKLDSMLDRKSRSEVTNSLAETNSLKRNLSRYPRRLSKLESKKFHHHTQLND